MAGPRWDSRGGRCLAPHNDHEVLIFPTHLQPGQCRNLQGKEAAEDTGGKQSNAGERSPLCVARAASSLAGAHSRAGLMGSWHSWGCQSGRRLISWGGAAPSCTRSLPVAGLTSEGGEDGGHGRDHIPRRHCCPHLTTVCSRRSEAEQGAALALLRTQDGHWFQKSLWGSWVMSRRRGTPREADRQRPGRGAGGVRSGGRVAVGGPVPALVGGHIAGGGGGRLLEACS